ncbi:MAG: hypothetical protein ACE5HC_13770 [Candidatus Binatia bacterium]
MEPKTRTKGVCVRAVSAPLPARLPSARMPQEIIPVEAEIPEMESSMEPLPALPSDAEASPDYLAGIGGALRAWQHKGSLRRWAEVLAVEVNTLKIFLEHKRVCGQIRNQDLSDEYVRGTSEYGIELNRLKIAQLRKAREGLEER